MFGIFDIIFFDMKKKTIYAFTEKKTQFINSANRKKGLKII